MCNNKIFICNIYVSNLTNNVIKKGSRARSIFIVNYYFKSKIIKSAKYLLT